MNLIYITFGAGFSLFGLLFSMGKIHTHIAAWKAMSEEEKDGILIGPLCRNIGEVIALCGLIFLTYGFIPGIRQHWFTVAMIAWLIVAGSDLWWIEKSRRYQKVRTDIEGRVPAAHAETKRIGNRRKDR